MGEQDLGFYDSTRYRLVLSLALGLFLYLFLIVFLPFGVSNYDPRHQYSLQFLAEISIFGWVTTLFALVNEFGIRPLLFRRATTRRVILWSAWTCLFLSQVLFVTYNAVGGWHQWHLRGALEFLVNVTAVLVFPLTGTFFFFRHQSLQRQLQQVLKKINAEVDPEQLLTFTGQGSGDRLVLRLADFLYARAQDNYVELNFLRNGRIDHLLIRTTLTGLADSLASDVVVRCHRSYLVNLYQVRAVHGAGGDLRLQLRHLDDMLPVSKTFSTDIMRALKKVKTFG